MCPTLIIGLERFNNQNFNDFIWNLIKVNNYDSYLGIRGRFVAEFTLDKKNKFKTINVIEKIKSDGFRDFNKNIIQILEQSLNHWTTAKINGMPVEAQIKVTISSSTQIHSEWNGTFEWIITPNFSDAYYNEGVKMFEQKNYEEAIKFFDETLYLTSKDIDAYITEVSVNITGDKAGACEDWNIIKSLNKPDADNLLNKYCQD